jgi:transposase
MPTTPLFPLPEGLEITSISERAEEVQVRVTSHRQTSPCPCCATPSSAIHSYYRRKPQDLPCAGRPIQLLLTVKKFFCRVSDCPRKIFVERLPDLIAVSSRLTLRLRSAVQEISLATCGKGGERLAGKLGIPLSDATLLWSLYLERVQEGYSSGSTPLGVLSGRFRGISQPSHHQTNHRQTHHTFTAAR